MARCAAPTNLASRSRASQISSGPGLSCACPSCTTGLAHRSDRLSTPAGALSNKIATLKVIFSARNPTEKRDQVSMVYRTGGR